MILKAEKPFELQITFLDIVLINRKFIIHLSTKELFAINIDEFLEIVLCKFCIYFHLVNSKHDKFLQHDSELESNNLMYFSTRLVFC